MDPILDIRPVRADLFTYSLRAPGHPPRLVNDFFGPAEWCLHDAAEALNHYFDGVELQLAGEPLGVITLAQLHCPLHRQQILARVQARLTPEAFSALSGGMQVGADGLRAA